MDEGAKLNFSNVQDNMSSVEYRKHTQKESKEQYPHPPTPF